MCMYREFRVGVCVHPRVTRESADTLDRGGRSVCPSRDDPGIVTVTRESADTLTERVGVCVHPGIILG